MDGLVWWRECQSINTTTTHIIFNFGGQELTINYLDTAETNTNTKIVETKVINSKQREAKEEGLPTK